MAISTWERREAVSGIVFVVLALVATFLPGEPPTADDPVEEMVSFFVDNRNQILTASFINGLALIPFLWFAGVLRSALRRWGDEAERLAAVSFGAAVLTGAFVLAGQMVATMLAYDAKRDATRYVTDAATVTALFDVGAGIGYMSGFAIIVFLGAASLVMLRTRALPNWLGWLGGVTAVLWLIGQFLIFVDPDDAGDWGFVGLLPFLLLLVWVVLTSLLLMRTRDTADE